MSIARQAYRLIHRVLALGLITALATSASMGQTAVRGARKSYVLRNAQAEDIAPQVREALGELAGTSDVFVDAGQNRILVSGGPESQAAAAELIRELDAGEEETQEPESKSVAKGYTVDPEVLDSTLASLRELYKNQPSISINADKRTSKIVVFAPADVQAEVAEALAATPQTQVRQEKPKAMTLAAPARRRPANANEGQRLDAVHRFNNLSWRDLESALSQIWGDAVEVTPDADNQAADVRLRTRDGETHFLRIDRNRNQLEVTQAEPAAKWKQFARVLDGLETKPGQEAQVMTVAHAKPTNVREVVGAIQQSIDLRGKKPLAAQALRRDPKTAKWGGDLVSRVFQQEPAQPAPGAAEGAQPPADEDDPLSGFGNIGPVQIEYIEGLDLLLLIGDPEDVAKVKKLIELLDSQPEIEPDVEIVPLKYTNNEVLAPMLTQINDQVLANRQGRVTIIPLGKPNSIMLIGQKSSIEVLVSYIEKLDIEIDTPSGYKVIRLRYIPAVDAETAIRNFFQNRPGTGTQQNQGNNQDNNLPGLGVRPRIVSEARSNSLIVQGGAGDLRDVEALIKEIDVEDSPSMAEMRIFKLKSSLATDLAPLLQSAITGQSSTGGTGQQGGQGNQGNQGNQGGATGTSNVRSPSLQFVQVLENGQKKVIESGIPTNVVIEADAGANALIVRGPSRTLDVIGHLIEQLDGVARVGASIKVFNLLNADAQQVLTNLQNLFGVTQGAANQATQGAFTPATAEGESPLVRLRFAIDRRSNSLIVAGNPGDLNMIEALLGNIDTPDVRNRRIYVYRLVNNDAQFVATAVQTLITNQQNILRNQAQTQFLYGQLEFLDTEVFIQPELVTNSVIISATPRKLQEIIRVVQQLDLRQPMVMVQMLIAEVALQNFDELGAEFGLQDAVLFNRGVGATGLNPGFPFNNLPLGNNVGPFPDQSNNVGTQGLSSFNMGRTSADRGYGGFVLSASSESVSVLIRALQERSRLEILSRPEVMTVDRIPAQVLVGERVPLLGNTTTNGLNVTSSVTREPVGLSLLVTPQVNADGQIIVDVEATRSALGALADGIPIPAGETTVLQPRINVTTAVSTVSCRSGQTVVMAGLITKTRQTLRRGVPGLMEIPVLGRLFRFDADSERRTELLMIMTPHIIWDGDDLNWLKQTESERMSWCMADVVEVDGDRGLSPGYGLWGSMNMNRIFPHTQPRGVYDCTPPPGPPPFLERLRSDITGCPPTDQAYGSNVSNTPGPPSELENRSNWGPMASPHHLLRHPDETGPEEVGPPAPEPTPNNEPLSPPRPGLESPGDPLEPPPPTPLNQPSASTSVRSATKTRNASTRRSATRPSEEDERESPPPVQSASRRPAGTSRFSSPKETIPARYESPSERSRPRDVEPAGYSDLKSGASTGSRRTP